MHMIECLFDGSGCCGDDWQLRRTYMRRFSLEWRCSETLFFLKSLSNYVLVFSKQTYGIYFFKYFYNRIPQARTRNNRPFSVSCFPSPCSDDLCGSNNEASSSIKSLALRHGQVRAAGLFHLVIFKDDIHSLSAFCYCLHPDPPPSLLPLFSPSCDSLMKRSPLNWKTVIKMRWVLFTSVHEGKPAQLSWLIKS